MQRANVKTNYNSSTTQFDVKRLVVSDAQGDHIMVPQILTSITDHDFAERIDFERSLSVITSLTFAAPDLNKIAETLRKNQAAGTVTPTDPEEQIFIDDNGDILLGNQVTPDASQRLSRVTQETFYVTGADRLVSEKAFVATHMPKGTYAASDDVIDGWVYSITNEFGDRYDLFIWYEVASATYKVSLISPKLAGVVGMHDCHLYNDGTLCLKKEGGAGYRSMSDAYARSAVWTRGASCFRRGYGFQFNVNQVG